MLGRSLVALSALCLACLIASGTHADPSRLLDPNGEAPRAWRVRLLPASYVVAPDGAVRYSVLGEIDWNGDVAVSTLRELLR